MFTKKKTFVEICFTERELDILKEAGKIGELTQAYGFSHR